MDGSVPISLPVFLTRSRYLTVFALATGVLLGLRPGTARAQGANSLSIQGGALNLVISTATPGTEPAPVLDSATTLRWGRPSVIAKIAVSTSCPGQSFDLVIEAVSPTRGIATGPVPLLDLMAPTDLIVDLPTRNGTSTLRYTASASVSQGSSADVGIDTHTITFTLIAL